MITGPFADVVDRLIVILLGGIIVIIPACHSLAQRKMECVSGCCFSFNFSPGLTKPACTYAIYQLLLLLLPSRKSRLMKYIRYYSKTAASESAVGSRYFTVYPLSSGYLPHIVPATHDTHCRFSN